VCTPSALQASHAEIVSLVGYMDVRAHRHLLCAYTRTSSAAQGLILDLDALLAADANFLLGFWLNASRGVGLRRGALGAAALGFNALNQITSWGPSLQINDHAAKNGVSSDAGPAAGGRGASRGVCWREGRCVRVEEHPPCAPPRAQWSGLVSSDDRSRWALFGSFPVNATAYRAPPDWDAFAAAAAAFEEGWGAAQALADFPTAASGAQPLGAGGRALNKYARPPAPRRGLGGAGWTLTRPTRPRAPGPRSGPSWGERSSRSATTAPSSCT